MEAMRGRLATSAGGTLTSSLREPDPVDVPVETAGRLAVAVWGREPERDGAVGQATCDAADNGPSEAVEDDATGRA